MPPSSFQTPSQGRDTAPRYGLRALAASVARVARPALRKRGLAAGRIVSDWPEIVGPELAAQCIPEGLSSGGKDLGGVLQIRVAGPLALELQHLEPVVIEKINGHFGYRAVARLRLVQGPLPTRPAAPPPTRRPLGAAEEAEIDAHVAPVAEGELKSALARLGRAIAGRES